MIYHLLRLVLALVLFVVSSQLADKGLADLSEVGWPYTYSVKWGPCPREEVCHIFSWINLALNAAFWYAVSFLTIEGVRRLAAHKYS